MRLRIVTFIFVLLAAVPIWAHHGSTGFDRSKSVHLVGKITMLEWTNPHVVVHLEVTGADGKSATWLVNTIPPGAAKFRGLSQNSFAIGTELSIDGYQAIDGSNRLNGGIIVFPDGQKLGGVNDCYTDEQRCFHPTTTR